MFRVETQKSGFNSALLVLELIYHSTVQSVRRSHRHAMVGLIMNIFQTVLLIAVFYVMFNFLGMRGNAIRGDFVVYLMSGIFLFMANTKAMGAVLSADGPTSAMMLHAPMNTAVAICSSALASLYIQVLSVTVILGVYHIAFGPIQIDDPVSCLGILLLSWLNGVAVGMVVMAMRPWWPDFVKLARTLYMRVNMFASGKMFVANTLSYAMLKMFDWNPLFHIIDQARGYAFINYYPQKTSLTYPLYITLALLILGLMGEFYTRRNASLSWTAGR
ncbi:ABC transporter permease [Defluviimonas sp. WL0050]|uniref:ABC transporter permease n=1 Tax=Albidovulum litorale TaxID=2984134 RepID=A0ABT2ZRT4_9RHOB|nr:ABC transporter permease [Defluviimonas sp. WL0050]MCV2873822.1 ABC transporter permease [Defluviimonas sp. WL0050]